jgi:hypothetical protein
VVSVRLAARLWSKSAKDMDYRRGKKHR